MPEEWSKILTKPVISREDYAKSAKTRDITSSTIPIDTSHASSRMVITPSQARQSVAREGTVHMKADSFGSRSWRQKWLVLTDMTLTVRKTEASTYSHRAFVL
jgi:ferric-dicitrate binding protein FerR (iron transport regulator)